MYCSFDLYNIGVRRHKQKVNTTYYLQDNVTQLRCSYPQDANISSLNITWSYKETMVRTLVKKKTTRIQIHKRIKLENWAFWLPVTRIISWDMKFIDCKSISLRPFSLVQWLKYKANISFAQTLGDNYLS